MTTHSWTALPARRAVLAASLLSALVVAPLARADVTLNFANADIDQIARAIGAATNQTIVVDPRVKGQLSLQSDRPVSNEQALKTLQAALRMQGFALLEDHGILKVVPEADAKLQGVPTFIGNRTQARGDTVVTQVFQLHNASANNLLPVIRPLVSPNNTVAAYPNTNSIIVTDYADNVRRIGSIIAGIDSAEGTNIDVIPLANANAQDVAAEASKLLDPGAIGATDATLKVNVSVDSRTNSVILRASNAARMRMAHELVRKLDSPTREPGNIHVVPLTNADATTLAKTLRGMMGQSSDSKGATAGNSLFGNSGGQSGSGGGLANNNGSLPPLPSGTSNSSSFGSTSGSSGNSGGMSGLGGNNGTGNGNNGNNSDDSADQSGSGMIVADASTNSLIITAPEPVYRNLRNVIAQLDQRRAQIYIESMIIEVSSTKTGQFGVQWLFGGSGNNSVFSIGNSGTNSTTSIANITSTVASATSGSGSLSSIAGSNIYGIGIMRNFGSLLGVGGLLQAVQGDSDVNVLSTPNLMTMDNQEARILVGSNIGVLSGTIANTTSTSTNNAAAYSTYNRMDIGTMLNVRPQINQGGTIKLQIYQEDSSLVSTTDSNNPTINKRSLQTTVLADNGQIVVLGGLIGDKVTQTNSRVPWLSAIPILGALFRNESKQRDKTNLLLFLRPVIVRDEATMRDISMNRYDYMRALSANYTPSNWVIKEKTNPVPGPIAPDTEAPVGRAVINPDGTPGNQINGLTDLRDRERAVGAPMVSPNVSQQPPYVPDNSVPSRGQIDPPAPMPPAYVTPNGVVATPVPSTTRPVNGAELQQHSPLTYPKAQVPGTPAYVPSDSTSSGAAAP
ncbi:type II secretion system secretin GspD [Robbsia andropogonis]|uniref:type II secretion system secretin GspD n=1 Tax=Robbsia andropogonis TaxID=28092 RepID=UPI0004AE4D5D|nr:type II secretion system secretin GspD [Robbsia andropogonis]